MSRAVIFESVLMPWRLRFARRRHDDDSTHLLSPTRDEVTPE
jgi:hypothetical protein